MKLWVRENIMINLDNELWRIRGTVDCSSQRPMRFTEFLCSFNLWLAQDKICRKFWAEWQRNESGILTTQVSVRWGLWRPFCLVPPWLGIWIRCVWKSFLYMQRSLYESCECLCYIRACYRNIWEIYSLWQQWIRYTW